LFVSSLIGLALVSVFIPPARFVLIGELVLYFSTMILAGFYTAIRQHKPYLIFGLPLAIPAMHITWGSGFLWSMFKLSSKKNG
jgi:hypothetical protein